MENEAHSSKRETRLLRDLEFQNSPLCTVPTVLEANNHILVLRRRDSLRRTSQLHFARTDIVGAWPERRGGSPRFV